MISPGAAVLRWGRCPRFWCGLLAASVMLAASIPGLVQSQEVGSTFSTPLLFSQAQPPSLSDSVPRQDALAPATTHQDPLNSQFPIPWSAIWRHQTQATQTGKPVLVQYRSTALKSADGTLMAYADIELNLNPQLTQSRIFSTLVIANAQGAVVQRIPASLHLGEGMVKETAVRPPGMLSVQMPAMWSKDGQQLLVRQFEAVLGSDVSSDYALVWSRQTQQTKTFAPMPLDYDSALLLGWSQQHPDQILFRVSTLGEAHSHLVAVNPKGMTIASPGDRPLPIVQHSPPAAAQAHR